MVSESGPHGDAERRLETFGRKVELEGIILDLGGPDALEGENP